MPRCWHAGEEVCHQGVARKTARQLPNRVINLTHYCHNLVTKLAYAYLAILQNTHRYPDECNHQR